MNTAFDPTRFLNNNSKLTAIIPVNQAEKAGHTAINTMVFVTSALYVQLDIVGGEQARRSIVVAKPPVIIRKL